MSRRAVRNGVCNNLYITDYQRIAKHLAKDRQMRSKRSSNGGQKVIKWKAFDDLLKNSYQRSGMPSLISQRNIAIKVLP